ncbi:hypothetical protein CPB86DRAFT_857104 [Serendipita vermifera]|nr:hypothetical protein CPB86DRAFT_857104 [Serendipita vermifera]
MPSLSLAAFERILTNLNASYYLTASAAVILLYDYILTFSDEVEHVWRKPVTLVTVLFYINRYLPIPIMLVGVHRTCQVVVALQPIAETVSYIAASLLLVIRVLTLYHKNRLLSWVMYGIFLLTHTIGVAIMVRTLVVLWPAVRYSRIFNVCIGQFVDGLWALYYMLPLEVILIVLQAIHLFRHRHLVVDSGGSNFVPLLRTIYLDGSVYFVIVFCLRLTAGTIFITNRASIFYIATWMEYSFSSLTVSRLFLHLRRVASETESGSASPGSTMRPFSAAYNQHRSYPSNSTTIYTRSDLVSSTDQSLTVLFSTGSITVDLASPPITLPETNGDSFTASAYVGQSQVRQSTLVKVAPFNYTWKKDSERALPPLPEEP